MSIYSFLTIEGVLTPAVLGGGMNITGVRLNFSNGSSPLADFVSSFQAVCDFGGCAARWRWTETSPSAPSRGLAPR